MKIENHECFLGDDGTLDTVIIVDGKEYRFDTEFASQYRTKSGKMTKKGFVELCNIVFGEIAMFDYDS
jgi:hypothetical protein